MHLWKVTFHVGDFGTKAITVKTEERTGPDGGFGEAERLAWEQAQQETTGWPNPVEMIAIEYIDEIDNQQQPATTDVKAASKPKKK